MDNRTLRLRKASLADLTPGQLGRIAGGTLFCTSALTHCDPVCEATTMIREPEIISLPTGQRGAAC